MEFTDCLGNPGDIQDSPQHGPSYGQWCWDMLQQINSTEMTRSTRSSYQPAGADEHLEDHSTDANSPNPKHHGPWQFWLRLHPQFWLKPPQNTSAPGSQPCWQPILQSLRRSHAWGFAVLSSPLSLGGGTEDKKIPRNVLEMVSSTMFSAMWAI